ncbi:MAG: DNA polymerase III subunit gamma/tau [Candidatus Paceibacterota bacterium]|jgi:DNA polymerase-3 subunit gamma/tau
MENLVIYRKYRPQTFAQVIGQDHLVKTVTYAISQGKPAHAYLFSGTRGVGKTTVARLIAKALNCEVRIKNFKSRIKKKSLASNFNLQASDYEPCNKCASCVSIDLSRSVDLLELDAASHRGIDEAKSLIESVKYPPVNSKYKVFIIDEVHMLTKEAFNSLLKTIEEPPPYAVFILATTEPQKVPQTIISRCQYFELKRLSVEDIKTKLKMIIKEEGITMDKRSLDFIARGGRGSFRDMESLLEQIISQSKKDIAWQDLEDILGIVSPEAVRNFLGMIFDKDAKKAINFIGEIFSRGKDLEQLNTQIIDYLRLTILGKIDKTLLEAHNLDKIEEEEIVELGKKIQEAKALRLIELYAKAYREVNQYPSSEMSTEIATIEAVEILK